MNNLPSRYESSVNFASYATNLVPGDTNNDYDIFVHDTLTGVTTGTGDGSYGVPGGAESVTVSGGHLD